MTTAQQTLTKRELRQAEALERARNGQTLSNWPAIFDGFMARGIPEEEIKPRENVLTYNAWRAAGRQVRKGERGVKVCTFVEPRRGDAEGDDEQGKRGKVRKFARSVAVFHISQTDPIAGAGASTPDLSRVTSPAPEGTAPALPPGAVPIFSLLDRPRDHSGRIARLERICERCEEKAEALRNSGTHSQNPTRRRLAIMASQEREADALDEIRGRIECLIDLTREDKAPRVLHEIPPHFAKFQAIHHQARTMARATKDGWSYTPDFSANVLSAWSELENRATLSPEKLRRREIQSLERDLHRLDLPGFFPTPPSVVKRMIDAADLAPGQSVLEPSAGKGDIADAIAEAEPQTVLTVCEISPRLKQILEAKGHSVVASDFTEFKHPGSATIEATAEGGMGYDRILMNPPFEKGQDMEHIRRAFKLLNDGGRLVAICSEGPFFRSDNRSRNFREWLDDQGAEIQDIDGGAFAGPESFRQTRVKTRLVIIDKAIESAAEAA